MPEYYHKNSQKSSRQTAHLRLYVATFRELEAKKEPFRD